MWYNIVVNTWSWILLVSFVLTCPLLVVLSTIRGLLKPLWEKRKNISGEVALITGGANGLGKEIAIKLAAKGCHIAVADINEEAAKATANLISTRYNVNAKAFKVDVTKYEEVVTLASSVEEQLGPVSILINNAGMLMFSSSTNVPPHESQQMIDTNLTAHVWTVRVFLEKMITLGKGHIVAISSIGGLVPTYRQLEYTATKFGVRGLMMALQTEIFARSCDFIKTTTVLPYFLKTNAKVLQVYKKTGMESIYPSVSGEVAAEKTVEGILTNQNEVFIPRVAVLLFKFMELLPREWYMFIMNNSAAKEIMLRIEW